MQQRKKILTAGMAGCLQISQKERTSWLEGAASVGLKGTAFILKSLTIYDYSILDVQQRENKARSSGGRGWLQISHKLSLLS